MKAKVLSERSVENLISSYLRFRRIFFFKHDSVGIFDPEKKVFRRNMNPYRIRGVSDLILVYQGRFVGLEIKNARGKPSEHQLEFIRNVTQHGGYAFIVRTIEDVAAALKKVDEDLGRDGSKSHTNAPEPKTAIDQGYDLVTDEVKRCGAI